MTAYTKLFLLWLYSVLFALEINLIKYSIQLNVLSDSRVVIPLVCFFLAWIYLNILLASGFSVSLKKRLLFLGLVSIYSFMSLKIVDMIFAVPNRFANIKFWYEFWRVFWYFSLIDGTAIALFGVTIWLLPLRYADNLLAVPEFIKHTVTKIWNWSLTTQSFRWPVRLIVFLTLPIIVGVGLTRNVYSVQWNIIETKNPPSFYPIPVESMAIDSNGLLYAGTWGRGVFVSEDQGSTWLSRSDGLEEFYIRSLLVIPDSQVVLAGTTSNGIYRSEDNGQSWKPSSTGITGYDVMKISADRVNNYLYAAVYKGGVFASKDGGLTWELRSNGLSNLDIRDIIIDAKDNRLFAQGFDGQLYFSDTAGEKWQLLDSPFRLRYLISSSENGTILASGDTKKKFGILLKSNNKGSTWEEVKSAPHPIYQLMSSSDESYLIARTFTGIYFSVDDGEHWKIISGSQGKDLLLHPASLADSAGNVYITPFYHDSILRINISGSSSDITALGSGLESLSIQDLAYNEKTKTLFAGTFGGGIYYSKDEGESWHGLNYGIQDLAIKSILVNPLDGSVYLTTDGGYVYQLDSSQHKWKEIFFTSLNSSRNGITISPLDRKLFFAPRANRIYWSEDNGENWGLMQSQGLEGVSFQGIYVSPTKSFPIIGTSDGIYEFDAENNSWHLSSDLMTSYIKDLIITKNGTMFAATYGDGIYRSTDKGGSWNPVNHGINDYFVLSLFPDSNNRIYAGTLAGDLYYSKDLGENWIKIGKQLSSVWSIQALPELRSIFVGTMHQGIYRFDYDTLVQKQINEGLSDISFVNFTVSSNGHSIWAQTSNSDFYYSEDSGVSWERKGDFLDYKTVCDLSYQNEKLYARMCPLIRNIVYVSYDNGKNWELGEGEIDSLDEIDPKGTYIVIDGDNLYMRRNDMGWLPWARFQDYEPREFLLGKDSVVMYAYAGPDKILKAEVPYPVLWKAPDLYLKLIRRSNSILDTSIIPHKEFYLAGSLMIAILLLVYTRVIRPNQFSIVTSAKLLVNPRYWFIGSSYKQFVARWKGLGTLEQLIILQAPAFKSFGSDESLQRLFLRGAIVEKSSMENAISNLTQRGFLIENNQSYTIIDQVATSLYQSESKGILSEDLAKRIRESNPLYSSAHIFFSYAGFNIKSFEDHLSFLLTSQAEEWQQLLTSPIFAKFFPGVSIDRNLISTLYSEALSRVDNISIIFAIVDKAPTDSGWIEIAALRADKNILIIPIDDTLIRLGSEQNREKETLSMHLRRFLGHRDLYNVRDPVVDRLNFFGRESLANDILDSLEEVHPVAVFGLRKLGKSSLLQYIRDRAHYPVALIDIQSGQELNGLFGRILESWERSLRVKLLNFDKEYWTASNSYPLESSDAFISQTRALLNWLKNNGREPKLGIFVDEVDLIFPSSVTEGKSYDQTILLRFLEFGRILRGLVQETGQVSVLVAGVDSQINRVNRLVGNQNALYQFFQEIHLGPLSNSDCMQMLRNIGRQMGIVYNDKAIEFAAKISGGHPFFARQLCSMAINTADGIAMGEIPLKRLREVSELFVRDPQYASLLDERGLWGELTDLRMWTEDQIHENEAILINLAAVDMMAEDELIKMGRNRSLRERSIFDLEQRTVLLRVEKLLRIRYGLFKSWIKRYRI